MYPVQIFANGTSRWVNLAKIRELEFFNTQGLDARCDVTWDTGDRERYNGALALALYDRWVEASCKIAARFPEPSQGQASIEACPPDESC